MTNGEQRPTTRPLRNLAANLLTCASSSGNHESAVFGVDAMMLNDLHLDLGQRFPQFFRDPQTGLPLGARASVTRIKYAEALAQLQEEVPALTAVLGFPDYMDMDLLEDFGLYRIELAVDYEKTKLTAWKSSQSRGVFLQRPIPASGSEGLEDEELQVNWGVHLTDASAEADLAFLIETYAGDQVS